MQSIIVSKHYSNIKSPFPGILRYLYIYMVSCPLGECQTSSNLLRQRRNFIIQ